MNAHASWLQDRAARACAVAAQYSDQVDSDARFPHEAIRALKESKLLAILIPRDLGGEGAGLSDAAEICAMLGQNCASAAMVFAMHQIKTSSLVTHGVENDWHRTFLRRIADEQLLLASATTEGGGIGGNMRNSICAIERNQDRFTLQKDASVISYATEADAILVTARRDPEAPASDQVMAVVLKDQYVLEKTGGWNTLGMRGTCSEGFILKCSAPATQILPKPFAEIAAQSMLATAHILWSSLWYGIAASAAQRAQGFVRAEARKKPGSTPVGATRLTEATSLLSLMKSSILAAITRFEHAKLANDELNSIGFAIDMNNLKISASQLLNEIVRESMMICGIMGYRNDSPYSLGRQMRDAMSAPLMINNDRISGNTASLLLAHRLDPRLAS